MSLEILRTCPNLEIHISEHFFPEGTELFSAEVQILRALNKFVNRPTYKRFIQINNERFLTNEKIVVLRANSSRGRGKSFYYLDGKQKLKVQDWVNENDGKGSTLVVLADNPDRREVHSQKSVIVHPVLDYDNPRLFVPQVGYVL